MGKFGGNSRKNAQETLKNDIIATKNKAQIMNDLSILTKDGKLDYSKMGEIEILPDALSFDEFVMPLKIA